jgi:hydrogenase maturation protein HypF
MLGAMREVGLADEIHAGREGGRESAVRRAIFVRGVVQGVGFRPFAYRLAQEEALAGWIGNDTEGVTIEVEGPQAHVDRFQERLAAEMPALARIDAIASQQLEATGERGFRIVASEVLGRVSTGIPADAATCEDCLRELFDPADRRYRYPFLNCTNCGPRYTITRRIPYDRPQTSMARFPMCADCQKEYQDPANRRFHAQPNACWVCGPQIAFRTSEGAETWGGEAALERTIELLAAGKIVAIKGIGGFHLSVDATNESAVKRLRERKHRYGKPLAVMVRDVAAARAVCALNAEEEALLKTHARPIVLARKREGSGIAANVAPDVPWLGVFLPYAPLHHLIFADARIMALIMTSANLSEEPIAIDNEEALNRLGGIADALLMHDREILQRCDDSVMAIVDGAPQLLRRSRGFVPLGIPLPVDAPPLLAVGGHLKNVLALARGRLVYQSQHLGDLENLTGIEFFKEALEHLMRTFEIEPLAVAHDLHPEYPSTRWATDFAREKGLALIGVQHHHAHLAGCMAEHGIDEAIGLALDGTGYGTDGRIWGGEVLIARMEGFERFAHLEYLPMPGGDAAVKEPWRMAYSALRSAGIDVGRAAKLSGADAQQARVIERIMERGIHSPLTSSLGRLFDAVGAVLLGRRAVDYEAQMAVELEGLAIDEIDDFPGYVLDWVAGDHATSVPAVMKADSMWREVLQDLDTGVSKTKIAARFHAGISAAFQNAAVQARQATGLSRVAMSGGCMHNRRLTRLLRAGLEAEGFAVYLSRRVSPGDGGLSYGQAAVASALFSGHR